MADKDKKDSSLRKLWRWLVSTDIGILLLIEFPVVLVGAIAGVIIWCFKGFTTFGDGLEFFRVLITTMIAVGGGYGLILAARRSAKFSEQVATAQKQVEMGQRQVGIGQRQVRIGHNQVEIAQKQADTAQRQLFNEQLGRGAELLANGEIIMRQTGIRVLGNLAERTIGEPEQVKLTMQIIHDFVRSKTSSPSKDKEASDKNDIALGIRTLGSLCNRVGKSDDLDEFTKLLNFSSCHLEKVGFSNANLQGAYFMGANLRKAHFRGTKLQGVDFMGAKLQGAYFKGAKLQWVDCSFANFSNAEDLKEDQIKGMIFYAENRPILPKCLELSLDPKRSYELKEDPDDKSNPRRRFVKSNAEWSGRVVHEWIREYLASIRGLEDD